MHAIATTRRQDQHSEGSTGDIRHSGERSDRDCVAPESSAIKKAEALDKHPRHKHTDTHILSQALSSEHTHKQLQDELERLMIALVDGFGYPFHPNIGRVAWRTIAYKQHPN